MKRLSLSLAALALALCCAVPAAAKTYINGIDANYPPFAYVGEDGKPSGFDVDAMNWIANAMGFEVQHQPMDWDGIIPALLGKKIDMICSGMSISPERAAAVAFSEPYFTIAKVILTGKDSTLTVNEVMQGKYRLGVQRGTNEHEYLETKKAEEKLAFDLRFYDSSPMAVEDLLNGRIDAIALDSAPANDAINKGKAVKIVGTFAPDDVFGVAVNKDDTELLELINEGYRKLMANPYWVELQNKYLK
ncbi:MAG: amino acid ABC transporter substrate-binding protein [Desulfovibrionaceae bacterium]|nr:amino acid ABC transporter substrate-binding protein [Desulfovibrionaceae bacterium]